MKNTPILKGRVHADKRTIRVWCPECNKSHYHKINGNKWTVGDKSLKRYVPVNDIGCKYRDSKYKLSGYYVMEL